MLVLPPARTAYCRTHQPSSSGNPSSTAFLRALLPSHSPNTILGLELMAQLLKERDEDLERLAEENERLMAEIATYALVLQGCIEAQDTEHERNRAAAIRVSKEWNDNAIRVSALLAKFRTRYGNMQRDTKLTLNEQMLTLLPTIDGVDIHISNLQDMFDISEIAGFPVDADRQVEFFRESVCAQPLIGKLLETFDVELKP
jgi:hypothetical protein